MTAAKKDPIAVEEPEVAAAPEPSADWSKADVGRGRLLRVDVNVPGGFLLDALTATNVAESLIALRRLADRAVHPEDLAAWQAEWYASDDPWAYEDIQSGLNKIAATVMVRPTGAGNGSAGT